MMENQLLEALQLDKEGLWMEAHTIVQDLHTPEAAAIHAYLHRKEGDDFNAGYWYGEANVSFFSGTLDEEWDYLVNQATK